MRAKRRRWWTSGSPLLAALLALGGCSVDVVKSDAWDPAVVERLPGIVADGDEREVVPGPAWLPPVDRDAPLSFVALREVERTRYCLVIDVDRGSGDLALLPLADDGSPVAAVMDPARRASLRARRELHRARPGPGVVRIAWLDLVTGGRLGPPVPAPRVIFAAAANFPSHLKHDLAIEADRDVLSARPPRVFRKHPAVWPAGTESEVTPPFRGVVGPFDALRYPARVRLPPSERHPEGVWTEARVDYEVELGIVIGRPLTLADLERDPRAASNAIAGFVLVSDTKTRNAPVFLNIRNRERAPAPQGEPYRIGDSSLDRALGNWGPDVCRWWSHASSCGDFSAIGPIFRAHEPGEELPEIALVAARTYAPADLRGSDLAMDRRPGAYFLRQASVATQRPGHPDRMIWSVDAILRSILRGDGVLEFPDGDVRLLPGDVVALGTPGGVALTGKSQWIVTLLRALLSTFSAIEWHDRFFDQSPELYLLPGDRIFYWGDGLGYQDHAIERVGR